MQCTISSAFIEIVRGNQVSLALNVMSHEKVACKSYKMTLANAHS